MKLKRLLIIFMTSLVVFTSFLFLKITAAGNGIVEVGSGEEKLYAIFDPVTSASDYNAYYKKSTDSDYTKIDSQLVRSVDSKIRIDAVGLEAGSYYLKFVPIIAGVESEATTIELKDIVVTAYDRSGYAHHNYTSGVGAYNDDGTLKDGAVVVYVNESNKNSVTATINNKQYTGLANILKAQKEVENPVPVDIRIIGTVGAAMWHQIEYDPDGTYKANKNLPIENVIGLNNVALPHQNLDESAIISGKYNSLDESKYSKLNGLTNKITYSYDSEKDIAEFDSYYNMLDVDTVAYVTVEGIGSDATIDQWGFTWKRSKSIEVRNLTFENYPEDACAFQGTETKLSNKTTTSYDIDDVPQGNIWVHHNTFNQGKNVWDVCRDQDKHEGDGATDVKFHKDITYAYNHYYNNHKTGLVGGSENNITANVTFHHNWYQENQSRMPYARQANMHMYNNYYDSSTGTTMQIYAGAYAFIENCYFKNDKEAFKLDNKNYTSPAIKSYNNIFDGSNKIDSATIVLSRTATVSNGNIFNSSFDTDSEFFYYKNGASDVEVMNSASELPSILPGITGPGIVLRNTYTVIDNTTPEDEVPVAYDNTSKLVALDEDFSSPKEINNIAYGSTPTNPGIYQSTNASSYAGNYLTCDDDGLYIYDSTTSTTTGYYIFANQFSDGIVKYTVEFTADSANSKWTVISFLGSDGNNFDIRSSEKVDNVISLGYSLDGGTTVNNVISSFSANTTYKITLTIDYSKNNNNASLVINDTLDEPVVINYNKSIKGLKFITTAEKTRYYHVNSVKVEKQVDNLLLGYQKGSYTSNNTSYKALRIVGKLTYNDIVTDVSKINSIRINIKLVNTDNEVYKTYYANVDDIYKSLELKNGTVIAPEEDDVRYYYTVIRGITSAHSGYKINATTIITLTNGQTIECSGFSYEIS